MFKYGLLMLASIWGMNCATKQLVGPYDIIVHKIYECNGMPTGRDMIRYGTKFTTYNRTATLYSSNVTLPNGLRDSMKALVDISILSNGVWRKNYINLRFNKLCSDANMLFPKVLSSALEAAGARFTGCPVKSGTYEMRNWTVNAGTSTGVFPYNTYRVEITLVESGMKICCFVVEGEAVPKP